MIDPFFLGGGVTSRQLCKKQFFTELPVLLKKPLQCNNLALELYLIFWVDLHLIIGIGRTQLNGMLVVGEITFYRTFPAGEHGRHNISRAWRSIQLLDNDNVSLKNSQITHTFPMDFQSKKPLDIRASGDAGGEDRIYHLTESKNGGCIFTLRLLYKGVFDRGRDIHNYDEPYSASSLRNRQAQGKKARLQNTRGGQNCQGN